MNESLLHPARGHSIEESATPSTQFTTTNVSSTSSNSYNVTNSYVVGGGVSGYQQFSLNGTNITEQSTGAPAAGNSLPTSTLSRKSTS